MLAFESWVASGRYSGPELAAVFSQDPFRELESDSLKRVDHLAKLQLPYEAIMRFKHALLALADARGGFQGRVKREEQLFMSHFCPGLMLLDALPISGGMAIIPVRRACPSCLPRR